MPAPPDLYIGRQRELETLRAALAEASAGRGRIAMLAGEPGIGKTRTALELANHAACNDVLVLWGHCHEQAGAPPYWPWVQVIRTALRRIDDDSPLAELGAAAGDIAEIVPEIRDHLPGLEPPAPLTDAAEARFRMFESIRQFLAGLSRRNAVLIVLDDVHWADTPSLRLLEFLAPEIAECRLLLLGTYRATELSRRHPLSDTLGSLVRVPHVARVHLTGLSAEEVQAFIAAAARTPPPDWLTSTLLRQTEGNPLFLREIVRLLEQHGFLGAGRAASLAALPASIRIPEGVKEAIGRRLNLLSASCNNVLSVAAVIGRDFAHEILRHAVGQPGEQAMTDALDEALEARIIEEATNGQYRFTHNLIRMTLYDELRPARRRQLHRIIGQAAETSRYAEINAVLPDLAHHFLAAGDTDKAIEYATRAGEHADSLLAFEDAVQFFQAALDAMEQTAHPDNTARCRLLLLVGEALRKTGDFPRALATLRGAADLATAAGEPELFARTAIAYERATWWAGPSSDPVSRDLLERALRQLPEAERMLRAQVTGALARALNFFGDTIEAKARSNEAIAMAQQIGDSGTLLTSLYHQFDITGSPERDEESFRCATEALVVGDRIDNLELVSLARSRCFTAFIEHGDIAAAEAELEALITLNARIRQRAYTVRTLYCRVALALMRGELDEAERIVLQANALMRRGGLSEIEDLLSVLIFALRREQGRLVELKPVVSTIMRQQPAASIWRPGLALIYLDIGQLDAARIEFEQMANAGFASLPRDGRWLLCLVYLTEVCAALGDKTRAAELYDLLLPYAGRNILTGRLVCCGSADRYLGLLCTTMSRWPQAERHFDTALAMNSRIGAHAPLAHTRHDYAVMLLARSAPGDRERAAALLRQCLDSAGQFGMRMLSETSSRRLAELAGAQTPPAGNDELTSREMEVLGLLAIGRSNADIAMVLEISLNTVATHVRNILSKTGSANRTEAAAYAMRHELVSPGGAGLTYNSDIAFSECIDYSAVSPLCERYPHDHIDNPQH